MLVTLGGRNTKVMLLNSKVEKPQDLHVQDLRIFVLVGVMVLVCFALIQNDLSKISKPTLW
jgi:hypothetical protein